MIVRPYYLDILKTYRDVPLVKVLAGIRRCGKSTILDMLKDVYKRQLLRWLPCLSG